MSKRRRRKKEVEGVDESWLLPYADLMTLLLALFIVLFASSSVDTDKLEKLSQVFNSVFVSGSGIMDNSSPAQMPVPPENQQDSDVMENTSYLEDQKSLGETQDGLEEYIAVNELENQFATELTEDGLLVTIKDSVLFPTGEAEILDEYLPIADELAELLTFDPNRHIVITGHTDSVPINNPDYADNWELSVMRAVNFLKLMVSNEGVNPLVFSAKGYGEYNPIASNDTEAGRSENRRVEVLIQPLVLEDGSEYIPNTSVPKVTN